MEQIRYFYHRESDSLSYTEDGSRPEDPGFAELSKPDYESLNAARQNGDRDDHSPYGGSVVYRYENCPGSVNLIRSLPKRTYSSDYAAEGTAAHEFAELCLREGDRQAQGYIGAKIEADGREHIINQEMVDAVQVYLDIVWDAVDADPDSILMVEQQFELDTPSAPGQTYGRNDALIYQPSFKCLKVIDFKYGVGVSVIADDNPQLYFYMTGAVFANPGWVIERVDLAIVQPRAWDVAMNGAVRTATATLDEVLDFAVRIDEAIKATQRPDAPLVPGSWCKFCAAAPHCPKVEAVAMETAQLQFGSVVEVLDTPLPAPEPDLDRINAVLNAAEIFEAWFSQVRKYADELLRQGKTFRDWKLVEKEGRRKVVVPPQQVSDYLQIVHGFSEDEAMPRKLANLTDIDKKLGAAIKDKEELREAKTQFNVLFTSKESSGLTLVHASDKRPAVNLIEASFADVTAD